MEHLIQGESLAVLKTMEDNSVDLVLMDPPYNFKYDVIIAIHKELIRIAKCIIVFCWPENQWVEGADQILFWIKPISTKNTSKSYSRFVEMIFIYGRNEWDPSRNWAQYTNVFHDLVDGNLHPHQKPESLITRLILNHTKKGDMVLDPFMGSGTTGVVCSKTDREFIGIDHDPFYFELARKRIAAARKVNDASI